MGDWEKEFNLQAWWLDRMATTTTPLQEKLTFFWHGHFATANYKVDDTRLMYQQNALFRSMAGGNFRDLVQQLSLQPAMLIWLDNDPNTKGHPNENFARELMELFTLGVDQYTQDDVVASARAWTGHNTLDGDRTQYHFYPNRHDTGLKTFMGVTQNWDGPDIVNFILRDDPTRKPIAARFIATKMWSFFAYPNPDDDIVTTLAIHVRRGRPHDRRAASARSSTIRRFSRRRRSRGSCGRRSSGSSRACGPSASAPPTRIRSGGWPTWASSCSSRPTCRAGGRTSTGSRPRGCGQRANWTRYIIWQNTVGDTLSAIVGMTVADAVQHAFDVLGIDSPSGHTRQPWRRGSPRNAPTTTRGRTGRSSTC